MHNILGHTHTVVHAYTLAYSMDNMYIYTYKMQCIAVLSLYTHSHMRFLLCLTHKPILCASTLMRNKKYVSQVP